VSAEIIVAFSGFGGVLLAALKFFDVVHQRRLRKVEAEHMARVNVIEAGRRADRLKNDLDHGVVQGLLKNLLEQSNEFLKNQNYVVARVDEIYEQVVTNKDDITEIKQTLTE
jgi:hypothetical protein